jgi:hypothetical protein
MTTHLLTKSAARIVLAVAGLILALSASAELLLSTSFSKNFPFGPFLPTESIEIIITLTNISPDQPLTICEGVCVGDAFTYSLGGLASIPPGYSFYFGDEPEEDVFDGQIEGTLLPGAESDFVFGIYTPIAPVDPGMYGFSAQLQIFAATDDRPMLASPTFSGNWEVACSQFPGGGSTGGCFPGPGPFPLSEPGVLSLIVLGLAGVGFANKRWHRIRRRGAS